MVVTHPCNTHASLYRQHPVLSTIAAQPRLLKLRNPQEACWHNVSAQWELIENSSDLHKLQKVIIFVHGINYVDPQEVVQDLVQPFAQATGLFREQSAFTPLVISWNSMMYSHAVHAQLQESLWRKWYFFLRTAPQWHSVLRDVERRAIETASFCEPLLKDMVASLGKNLCVVSHSLGGFLWSHLVKKYAQSLQPTLGSTWLNLQPAMPARAFCSGGLFEEVPDFYGGGQHISVWYSKLDCILSSLYLAAKPGLAMGLIGSPFRRITQLNVTHLAREAHGTNLFFKDAGHYFHRVRALLHAQAMDLKLTLS